MSVCTCVSGWLAHGLVCLVINTNATKMQCPSVRKQGKEGKVQRSLDASLDHGNFIWGHREDAHFRLDGESALLRHDKKVTV